MQEITKTYRGYATTDTVRVDLSEQSTKRLSDFLFVFGVRVSSDSVRVLFSIFSVIMPLLAYLSEIALVMHFNRQRKEINLKQLQMELEKKQEELSNREQTLNSKLEQVNKEFEQLSEQREQLSEQIKKWESERLIEQQRLKSEQESLNSKIQSFEQQKLRFKIIKEVIEKTGVEQFVNRGLNSRMNSLLNSSEQNSLNSCEQSLNSDFEQPKTKGEQFISIILNSPELSQNEIGRRIGMGPSSMSNFVKKYLDKGLVNRADGKWTIIDLEKALVFAKDGGSGE